MLSKAKLKLIQQLSQKKHRIETNCFLAEGPKIVGEFLPIFSPRLIVAVPEWLQANRHSLPQEVETVEVSADELRRASLLQHPQEVIGVFELPRAKAPTAIQADELLLVLDGVQDPGNVGTILRIADWFGIRQVVCSQETADAFSPKVVQATMGSLARVNVSYANLPEFLSSLPASTPIYGTLLDGENIYGEPLSKGGVIVVGNEGNGISESVRRCVNRRLLIPRFPEHRQYPESLNVAIATALVCAEFRRR